ncbi:tyrosine-type recombinase/integrase [Candidatus Woesearchaeota archaeon]|nr:tyrosine-type recombinase/integrase [Candidatus Woesearchaeota archaeon]
MGKIDIHNFDKQLKEEIRRLKESSISDKNKEIILKFVKEVSISESPSKSTKLKYYQVPRTIVKRYLDNKDLDSLSQEDLRELKFKIYNSSNFKGWTKQKFGGIIKKLFTWLKYDLSWLKTTVKRNEKSKVKAADILTEEEVKALIQNADTPRDKAFISMLYELGSRISEIGNMKIKDITKSKHGYILDIEGKTGHRTPILIMSIPYLTSWLNEHPLKDNPEAPLWVYRDYEEDSNANKKLPKKDRKKIIVYKHLTYNALKKIVKSTARKSGIKKRIYCHLFRHSRPTHLLKEGKITEAQAKVYFGWSPDSNMLSTYSHLISSDVNKALLQANGIIEKEESEKQGLSPKKCPRCQELNKFDAKYCEKCFSFLDLKTALEIDDKVRFYERFVEVLAKEINLEIEKDAEFRNLIFEKVFNKPVIENMLSKLKDKQ